MPTVRIMHAVTSFEGWKQAFESDPADRKGSGVLRYRVERSVADPNLVMIDLDFEDVARAEAFVQTMRGIWDGPGKAVMRDPQAWILETVEEKTV